METAILVAVIAAVPPTLATVSVFVQMVRNHKANVGAIQTLTATTEHMAANVEEVVTLRAEIEKLKAALERYRL